MEKSSSMQEKSSGCLFLKTPEERTKYEGYMRDLVSIFDKFKGISLKSRKIYRQEKKF